MQLFRLMCSQNVESHSYTCNFALEACTGLVDNAMGMEIYRIAVLRRFHLDPYFEVQGLIFLVKSSNMDEARKCLIKCLKEMLFTGIKPLEVMCSNASLKKQSEHFLYDR